MKKLLTAIAAAAAIFSASGCSGVCHQVESQQQCVQGNPLEDIAKSIVCVQSKGTYQDEQGETFTTAQFGSGLAYKQEGGWSYVTTNHHVVDLPDEIRRLDFFSPLPAKVWKKVDQKITIVDGKGDTNPDDDILLELIREDETLDTVVLRSETPLYVSSAYEVSSLQEHLADEVYVLGVPLAFEKGVTKGIVFNPQVELGGHYYTMLDITVQPGHSGSPVFVKEKDGRMYLVGQIRICMPFAVGICGGFGLATEMSELEDIWKINQKEPAHPPLYRAPEKEVMGHRNGRES